MATTLDTAAHAHTVRTPVPAMAAFLQELLGQRYTALITGQKDPKAIGQWAKGAHMPRAEAERRLRGAYQIATLLLGQEAPATVRAWFAGMNPQLGDRPPVLALADGETADVLHAARAFLADAGS
jgi:hypothetical protein